MLREAVASVMAQRDVCFELIVVDDSSTDGTCDGLRDWIAAFATPSALLARVVRNRRNQGAAAARNAGVAMVTAPLIAFLDSDDLWLPMKLSRQLAFMRASPGCQISQTDEIWLRHGRRVNPGLRHQKRAGDIFVDSLRTCLISPSAVMMQTELFDEVGGFDERMTAAEDYDLWLRILQHHEVGLLNEPLVTRRAGHPGQLSATTTALDRFRILALLKLLAATDLSDTRRRAIAEVLAEKCRIYGTGLARRGLQSTSEFILGLAAKAEAWAIAPDACLRDATSRMGAILLTDQSPDEVPSASAIGTL